MRLLTELRTERSVFFSSGNIIEAVLGSVGILPYYAPDVIGAECVDKSDWLVSTPLLDCRTVSPWLPSLGDLIFRLAEPHLDRRQEHRPLLFETRSKIPHTVW